MEFTISKKCCIIASKARSYWKRNDIQFFPQIIINEIIVSGGLRVPRRKWSAMEPDILTQSVTDLFLAAAPASPWVTSEECPVPLPLPALGTALGALGKSVKEWCPLPVLLRRTLFAATYAGAALLLLRSWRRSGEEGSGRTTELERVNS